MGQKPLLQVPEHVIGLSSPSMTFSIGFITISLLIFAAYYLVHLSRVMKAMSSTVQVFDIGEADSVMDFTITEREKEAN